MSSSLPETHNSLVFCPLKLHAFLLSVWSPKAPESAAPGGDPPVQPGRGEVDGVVSVFWFAGLCGGRWGKPVIPVHLDEPLLSLSALPGPDACLSVQLWWSLSEFQGAALYRLPFLPRMLGGSCPRPGSTSQGKYPMGLSSSLHCIVGSLLMAQIIFIS